MTLSDHCAAAAPAFLPPSAPHPILAPRRHITLPPAPRARHCAARRIAGASRVAPAALAKPRGPKRGGGVGARDTGAQEAALLDAIASVPKQGCAHVVSRDATEAHGLIAALVLGLEQTSGFGARGTARTRLLSGVWRLAATDALAVARNAGSVSGLAALLPGVLRCDSVVVALRPDGAARTVEIVRLLGLRGRNVLQGKWTAAGAREDRLEVTYASATLVGGVRLRADSKAVLTTTFCGARVRVGRSGKGDFYVFERVEGDDVDLG